MDLPRWQKAIWVAGYAFSLSFTVATLIADRILGRKP